MNDSPAKLTAITVPCHNDAGTPPQRASVVWCSLRPERNYSELLMRIQGHEAYFNFVTKPSLHAPAYPGAAKTRCPLAFSLQ